MMTLGVTVVNFALCGLSHAQLQSIFCCGVFYFIFLNFHDSMNNTRYHSVFLLLHTVLSQRYMGDP